MAIGRERVPSRSIGWEQVCWAVGRAAEVVLNEGGRACIRRIANKLSRVLRGRTSLLPFSSMDLNGQYRIWRQQNSLTPSVIANMREEVSYLVYRPVIGLVMPIADAQERWLKKTIESVRAQAYPYWELYLVHDVTISASVQRVIEDVVAEDSRIKPKTVPVSSATTREPLSLLRLASGEMCGLMGQHDELAPEALFTVVQRLNEYPDSDVLYSDTDTIAPDGQHVEPFFKPEWSPDLLLSMNYLDPFVVFRRSLALDVMRGCAVSLEGGIFDLILRVTEMTSNVAHISKVLYHIRTVAGHDASSIDAELSSNNSGKVAIEDALERRGEKGAVTHVGVGRFRVDYNLRETPLVSIIIPTRDRWQSLKQCIASIEERTRYLRFEIIVLDNGSIHQDTLEYLHALAEKWRVCRCPGPFNFSAINNFGASQAKGEYLLFLNDDTEVIAPDWLGAMVAQAYRVGVGAVGAKLLYPDGRIQHAGVVLGIGGVAGHAFRHCPTPSSTYHGFADMVRNCSAVTAACMLVPKDVFVKIRGFNEELRVEFNDVDLCLRIHEEGYRIVYTPDALLYHYENATRRGSRSPEDKELFLKTWGDLIRRGDPYYNPNLTLCREDWSLRV